MLEVSIVSDLTVIIIKNNVPKVVEVTDAVKEIIEKAYYHERKKDKINEKTKQ